MPMIEYTTKYLLKHKEEFGICRFCLIINIKTNKRCWFCGIPTRQHLLDLVQEDITPLLKLPKDTIFQLKQK